jgi:hypothetical protein
VLVVLAVTWWLLLAGLARACEIGQRYADCVVIAKGDGATVPATAGTIVVWGERAVGGWAAHAAPLCLARPTETALNAATVMRRTHGEASLVAR